MWKSKEELLDMKSQDLKHYVMNLNYGVLVWINWYLNNLHYNYSKPTRTVENVMTLLRVKTCFTVNSINIIIVNVVTVISQGYI